MIALVQGGSGSGKSAWAETLSCALHSRTPGGFYYVATMQVFDEEGERKVERHRQLRKEKGFQTVEQPRRLEEAARQIEAGSTVLLECLSNLVANEMFAEAKIRGSGEAAEAALRGIRALADTAAHLVIVTNNVFEDGIRYDEATAAYQKALGWVNQEAAALSDTVTELVTGIPIPVKRKEGAAE